MGCGCGKRSSPRSTAFDLSPRGGDWVTVRPDGKRQVFRGKDAKRHAVRVALATGGTYEQVASVSSDQVTVVHAPDQRVADQVTVVHPGEEG